MRRAVYVLMVICVAQAIAFEVAVIMQCKSISYMWETFSKPGQGRCINQNGMIYGVAGVHIVLDLVIIALPVPYVLRLQISVRKKIQVLSMFCVGLL